MQIAEKKRFLKRERLTLQNDIEQLFEKGQAFMAYPLRVVYVSGAAQNKVVPGLSVLVGAPKKRIRQAASRNRVKRLIREAYRLNKGALFEACRQSGKYIHIAFMYVSNDICTYTDMEKAVRKALDMIRKKEICSDIC